MTSTRTPVVFIHGLWLHATSWEPWLELSGRPATTPSRRAGRASPTPSRWPAPTRTSIADHGIEDVTAHYAEHHRRAARAADPDRPLLRRHDRREAARRGLRRGRGRHRCRADQGRAAAAAVGAALDAAGVQEPGQQAQGRVPHRRAVPLQLRQRDQRGESDDLYERWTIPAPGRPLFEAAAANFSLHSPAKVDTDNQDRGPLLLIMGGKDHTVPEAITKSTLSSTGTPPRSPTWWSSPTAATR